MVVAFMILINIAVIDSTDVIEIEIEIEIVIVSFTSRLGVQNFVCHCMTLIFIGNHASLFIFPIITS